VKKVFEDSTKPVWMGLKWRNKVVAGFTNSAAQHGDKLNTFMAMALFANRSTKRVSACPRAMCSTASSSTWRGARH